MVWDEWEQLKAAAAQRAGGGAARTRLDGAGAGVGGVVPLRTNPSGKQVAIKALRDDIRPGTTKAGAHSDESCGTTSRAFSGWETGSGLKDAHEEWALQVGQLKGRLAQDQASLEQTKQTFHGVDTGVRSSLATIDAGTGAGIGAGTGAGIGSGGDAPALRGV